MSDSDLIKLYSGRILALAADMPATDPLPTPDVTVRKRAPLCGSTVTVSVTVEADRITGYSQDVKACALGQAAASVVGRVAVGQTSKELIAARDQLRAMLQSDGPVPDAPFDGLEVLLPAREFRNRHASILLALDAVVDCLSEVADRRLTAR